MKKPLFALILALILSISFLIGCDFSCGCDGISLAGCTYSCSEGCTYDDDASSCFSPGQDATCAGNACSSFKYCVACADDNVHCLMACPFDFLSCTNHCLYFLNPAYCFMSNEQYEANCVNCIAACGSDCSNNCHPEYGSSCDLVGCILDSNGGGVEIEKSAYFVEASIVRMNVDAAGGYYNVIIDLIIKSDIHIQDAVCYVEVADSDGNYIKLRKYVGEIYQYNPGTAEFSFTFKGDAKDVNITNITLTGK